MHGEVKLEIVQGWRNEQGSRFQIKYDICMTRYADSLQKLTPYARAGNGSLRVTHDPSDPFSS